MHRSLHDPGAWGLHAGAGLTLLQRGINRSQVHRRARLFGSLAHACVAALHSRAVQRGQRQKLLQAAPPRRQLHLPPRKARHAVSSKPAALRALRAGYLPTLPHRLPEQPEARESAAATGSA